MSTQKQHDVVLEQRSDIKILMPMLKEMAMRSDAGVNINLIGPIYVHNDKREEVELPMQPRGEIEDASLMRSLLQESTENKDAVLIPDKLTRKFDKLFDEIPQPKLDATLRLVAVAAYQRTGDVKKVAAELRCSPYKARVLLVRYGVIES